MLNPCGGFILDGAAGPECRKGPERRGAWQALNYTAKRSQEGLAGATNSNPEEKWGKPLALEQE